MTGRPAEATPDQAPPAHYSYTAYADRQMADEFDRRRFGGPIGAILAETQERVLLEFLDDVRGRRIVDVGTGTGRAALALARRGAHVTGLDASNEMLDVARKRAAAERLPIDFAVCDAHQLTYPDAAFDMAVSLRLLMHVPDWRQCLGELCRVTRHRLVFDYPSMTSAAALEAGGRRVAYALGARVEAYRVLGAGSIDSELKRHGFHVRARHRQFVLPIALHKRIRSRYLTERIEQVLARAGLLRLLGSPVTVVAQR